MTARGTSLQAKGLVKTFGRLRASDGLDLSVAANELHAVIGPNGAGKSTLVAQLSGQLLPDQGQVLLGGADVTRVPVQRRARAGLVRTFQITNLLTDFSAFDNVRLAALSKAGDAGRFWPSPRRDRAAADAAMEALSAVGLQSRATTRADALSHGEQRHLEIAIALACNPTVLLMDEPLAGVGTEEGRMLVDLLGRLKGSMTIFLIEHDMDAVFALADRVTVLVQGRALFSGLPDAVRGNAAVRDAYLGEDEGDFGG